MRALLMVGLLVTSESVLADSFEFAGISRATTVQEVKKRYPSSEVSGDGHVRVSPKDLHDHIFGIQLATQHFNTLSIHFGSPDHKYPPCKAVESVIVSRHGPASEAEEFSEEAMRNRRLIWKLEREKVYLQCFRSAREDRYFAEAIVAYPAAPKPAPSNPGVPHAPASGSR